MTESYTYDAFGTLTYIRSLNEDGILTKTDTTLSRFLYAGEQYDEVTGLYYLRARRYDTTVGRFTQEDTYLGDGRNLYAYVQNNPLKYVDPSGYCTKHLGYYYEYTTMDPEYIRQCYEASDPKERRLNNIQFGLDVLGFIPVVGPFADLVNGIIYTCRGDTLNAVLSYAAVIPGIGDVVGAVKGVKTLKVASKAANVMETIGDTQKAFGTAAELIENGTTVVRHADEAAEVIVKSGSNSRIIPGVDGVVTGGDSTKLGKNMMEAMGLKRGTKWTGYQAQHIIPAEMADHPVLQKIGMDLDDASNGIFLRIPSDDVSAMSRHRGYHSVYSDFVKSQLDAMDINQSSLVLQQQVLDLQNNLRRLQQNGLPLYGGQGATIDLWQRNLNKLQ